MDSKFADVEEKLQDHDLRFEKIDNKLDVVLTQLDSMVGQFKKFDKERVFMSDRTRKTFPFVTATKHTS